MASTKVRGGHRAMASRLIRDIDKLMLCPNPDLDQIEVSVAE